MCLLSTCVSPLKTLPFPVVCERPHIAITSETEVGRVTYRPAKKFDRNHRRYQRGSAGTDGLQQQFLQHDEQLVGKRSSAAATSAAAARQRGRRGTGPARHPPPATGARRSRRTRPDLEGKNVTSTRPSSRPRMRRTEKPSSFSPSAPARTSQYEGSKEFEAQIGVRVQSGNPPDIGIFPQPGLLSQIVERPPAPSSRCPRRLEECRQDRTTPRTG